MDIRPQRDGHRPILHMERVGPHDGVKLDDPEELGEFKDRYGPSS